ncbi:hypothetical protein BKK79_36825 (plasmid) [Cupriavidus sp. USMAA2-4]|nr:hypothetical protein BKK79_36825 [Cupriavidus sp. USMAA2-4]
MTTTEVDAALARDCVVAIGVSGGKDSVACAIATSRYLDQIGHAGPRVLVHADLGRVEWKDSLPACERLAAAIGWELKVVARQAGDMLARWEGRWDANVTRYAKLECAKLVLPWSTPAMRFCTSELKTAVIASGLRKWYPGKTILNVAGIRRQESPARRKMPVSARMQKLCRKDAEGVSWHPIIEWKVEDVFSTIAGAGLELHEAYRVYGASRVSCAFCIMSSGADLLAAASCEENHGIYRAMVELEARSTFSFQSGKWLADAASHLLSDELADRVRLAKEAAAEREALERLLPEHLLYAGGWPTAVPTLAEAALVARVRGRISELVGIPSDYLDAESVRARYAALVSARSAGSNVAASRPSNVDLEAVV